jgi:hypothetical protein
VTLKSKPSQSRIEEFWYESLWYRSSDLITDIFPLVSYQTSCFNQGLYAPQSVKCIPYKMPLIRYDRLRNFGSTLGQSPAPSNPLSRSKAPITHIPRFSPVMDSAQTKSIAASPHTTKTFKPDLLSFGRSRVATQRIVSPLTTNSHFRNSAPAQLRSNYTQVTNAQIERGMRNTHDINHRISKKLDGMFVEVERQEKQPESIKTKTESLMAPKIIWEFYVLFALYFIFGGCLGLILCNL